MKAFRSKLFTKVITFLLVCGFMLGSVGVIAYADGDDTNRLKDTFKSVVSGEAGKNEDLAGVEEKVDKTTNSLINIASKIAFGVLIVSCIFTATRFSRVGDNAQKQNMLKIAVAFQLLGIIYLANVIGFIDFSFENLRLF